MESKPVTVFGESGFLGIVPASVEEIWPAYIDAGLGSSDR